MSLGDDELRAIMATFKSFDVDGDNSLSKDELSNILYRISNGQTLEEIDQEVDDIMETCDKDKSGQISYAEFFSTQKRHDFSPRAQAALDKLTNFMKLQEIDKKKIIKDNDENFMRLIKEKEQAILREQRDKEAEEAERNRRDELAKHGSPASPKITLADHEIKNESSESGPKSAENQDAAIIQNNDTLSTALNIANERITQLEQALATLEQSSTIVQQELHDKLSAADKSMKQIEEDRTKSIQELEQSLELAKKDLGTSQALNEQIADDNKKLREDKSIEGLRAKVRELEASNSELRGSLDLARQNNPDKEEEDMVTQLRLELAEEKEAKEEALAKMRTLQADLEAVQQKMEKSTQAYTNRLNEQKVAHSDEEVAHKELRTRFDELQAKYSQSIQSESQLEQEAAAVAAQLSMLQSENTIVKGNLAGACQEILVVQQRVQEEERRATEASRKLADALRSAEVTQRKHAEELRRAEEERKAAVKRAYETSEELRQKDEEVTRKDDELTKKDDQITVLREEIKQMQFQNLKLSNSIPPPKSQAQIEKELAAQVELREDILAVRRYSQKFQFFYVLWVILVIGVAYFWAPGCASGEIHPV